MRENNRLTRLIYMMQNVFKEPRMSACTYNMCPKRCIIQHAYDKIHLRIWTDGIVTFPVFDTKIFHRHAGLRVLVP